MTFIEHMAAYYAHHTKKATIVTHIFGIPLVMFSILVLLAWIRIPTASYINLAWVFVIISGIFYFFFDISLAIGMAILLIILGILATWTSHNGPDKLSVFIFVVTFVLGWILQFVGHWIEGKRPAFSENLTRGAIGPLFIIADICFAFGFRRDLQKEILRTAGQQHHHK